MDFSLHVGGRVNMIHASLSYVSSKNMLGIIFMIKTIVDPMNEFSFEKVVSLRISIPLIQMLL